MSLAIGGLSVGPLHVHLASTRTANALCVRVARAIRTLLWADLRDVLHVDLAIVRRQNDERDDDERDDDERDEQDEREEVPGERVRVRAQELRDKETKRPSTRS